MPDKAKWDEDTFDVEFLEDARNTSLDAAVDQLRLIYELKRRGVGGSPDASADALFKLGRLSAHLSLDAYKQWVELSKEHLDAIVNSFGVLGAKRTPAASRAPGLVLQARKEGNRRATARLVIENPRETAEEISVTEPIFRPVPGGAAFHAKVTVRRIPARDLGPGAGLRLQPGQSGKFELIFRPEKPFAQGREYTGDAHVLAGRGVIGRLAIEVGGRPEGRGTK